MLSVTYKPSMPSVVAPFETLSRNDTRHNNTAIILGVTMLKVEFYLLLCGMLLSFDLKK